MSMNVQVRMYAGLRHLVGDGKFSLSLPEHATVSTLRDRIVLDYPVLEAFMPTLVCAVDEEVQPPEHPLADGDMIDLIPPIAGG
ncbi:MAG: MoaD/ThiS family protein [Chloroflexota bacterium]|nr:MoaD/ThiS family protein [Chloroflexota bacterium]